MYDCTLAYIRLLPGVKHYCESNRLRLSPGTNHDLLFSLGIAKCFLLPLDYFINAGCELWELSERFWFACRGVESPILTAATAFFSSGPWVNFCTGLLWKIVPCFWPPDVKSFFPPIIWNTTGFRWHKMSSLAVGTTQVQHQVYSFFHGYLETEWKKICALYWAYLSQTK